VAEAVGKNESRLISMNEEEAIKVTGAQKLLIERAGKLYNNAQYKKALVCFESISKQNDNFASALSQCIRFCKNVVDINLSPEDELYIKTKTLTRYLWCAIVILAFLTFNILSNKENYAFSFSDIVLIFASVAIALALHHIYSHFPTGKKLRCKYCGHYIDYIDPNGESAYLGMNNCRICRRSYPMPSIFWDSFEGQTYIYGRGSVPEKIFYEDFEARNPNYPRSEMADKILRGKKS
jgi:hypothetical protein